MTPEEVADEAKAVIGIYDPSRVNICYTGGEPFLQSQKELLRLTELVNNFNDIECFSNGTIKYPPWANDYVNFIMDSKLRGSGEVFDGLQADNIVQNACNFTHEDAIKFTIASREDYEEAKATWRGYKKLRIMAQFYYGVVWGKLENKDLVGWVLEDGLPWKHNMQVHNIIWDRKERGI